MQVSLSSKCQVKVFEANRCKQPSLLSSWPESWKHYDGGSIWHRFFRWSL